MKKQLIEISKYVLETCLGLKENEMFLVVTDDVKKELGESLYEAGKLLNAEAMLLVMEERQKSGEEPPATVTAAMIESDVVVCITEHSLTHTQARKNAASSGTRIATMPGITKDMFLEGAISADYSQVKILTDRMTAILTKVKPLGLIKTVIHCLSPLLEGTVFKVRECT